MRSATASVTLPSPNAIHLLQRRQRVAHAATGAVRNQVKRIAFEFHTFGHAYRA